MIEPPAVPPYWFSLNGALSRPALLAKKSFAFSEVSRRNSKAEAWNWLRAGPGGQFDQRAGARGPRAVVRRLHGELLQRVGVRQHRCRAEEPVVVVRAVEPPVVLRGAQAVDADAAVVLLPDHRAGVGHRRAGGEDDELQRVAAVEREFLDLADRHRGLHGGRGGLRQRDRLGDVHRRLEAARLHRELEVELLAGDERRCPPASASGSPSAPSSARTARWAGPRSGRCRRRC